MFYVAGTGSIITLIVALVVDPYLGVPDGTILFSALVISGMPFVLLFGAAPNAITYNSKMFTTGEVFLYGIPASIFLMLVTWLTVSASYPDSWHKAEPSLHSLLGCRCGLNG
jgi:sodium-dependent dicarboxylate transporter 2/3/5